MRPQPPQVRSSAVLIGGGVAVLVSLGISLLSIGTGSQALLIAATPVGLAAGGAAAGRLAGVFGLLQGGMVGVLWILAEGLADLFAPAAGDVLADVTLTLLADAGRIAIGAAFGWLGARSAPKPSSYRGRDTGPARGSGDTRG
jgi:hypothetical protein